MKALLYTIGGILFLLAVGYIVIGILAETVFLKAFLILGGILLTLFAGVCFVEGNGR